MECASLEKLYERGSRTSRLHTNPAIASRLVPGITGAGSVSRIVRHSSYDDPAMRARALPNQCAPANSGGGFCYVPNGFWAAVTELFSSATVVFGVGP